jgi:PAS domain S-box-containing protein
MFIAAIIPDMSQSDAPVLPPDERKPARILLVDDSARNLDALESILASSDYLLHRAQSAQEALMALLDTDFAAVILDVQMPITSGVELAHLIKQRKRTQSVPLLFLTAHIVDPKDILQGYVAGAVDYLTKPVDPLILKTKIAIFADLYRKNNELAALNLQKENEIIRRQQAEELLLIANGELEARVKERTENLRHFAAIVESSEDAIVSKNLNSIITSWNQGAERLFGYQASEVIGQPVTILIPRERWDEEPHILGSIRRGERIEHYETIRQHKDGSRLEISLTVSPIKDDDGKVVGVSKIARDISRQKQAERELEKAHQFVLASSRAKDDFLATLSHELRTPLNPVLLLASDAAENPEFSKETRALFTVIQNNVELEARLIDDLLDINRIVRGKLALTLIPVDIHDVLKEAIATVEAEFVQKKVNLVTSQMPPGVICSGDAVRLKQVFWNILKNALKFTPTGGTVTIETRSSDREISIKIADTGIGMTQQELGSIFNAFSQGDHANEKGIHDFGGLGLGLAISQKLVELHSGQIRASSEGRDKGSTFVIEFPLAVKKDTAGSPNDAPVEKPSTQRVINPAKRILLVEDHEPTRTALTQLLTRRQHNVVSARTVAEALEMASRSKFDLVVSDIGLPDGDGYALMAELGEKYGLKGIALTGYGSEQDVIRGKNAGFISHLLKPVRIDTLDAALIHFHE